MGYGSSNSGQGGSNLPLGNKSATNLDNLTAEQYRENGGTFPIVLKKNELKMLIIYYWVKIVQK